MLCIFIERFMDLYCHLDFFLVTFALPARMDLGQYSWCCSRNFSHSPTALFCRTYCRKSPWSLFFWTMLRASLQLWQSLSCASIVIVRQRDQKERSGTMETKANQTKQNPKTTPQKPKPKKQRVPDQSSKRWNKVKQAQALTANYNPRLSQRLQQEIVKGQCSV